MASSVHVKNHGFKSGCIDIDVKYEIKPFTLSMKLKHSFTNHTIALQEFQINHSHFKLAISGFQRSKKSINFSQYKGYLILKETKINNVAIPRDTNLCNIRICRPILFEFSLCFDQSKLYLLCIDINGPSILSHRYLKIPNLIDLHTILKYTFQTTLLWQYNLFFTNGLLSIIFDEFLSRYCWIFPSSSIYHSLQLNEEIISNHIPDGNEHLDHGFMGENNQNMEVLTNWMYQVPQNYMVSAYYISNDKLDTLIPCKVNGIRINIDIKDDAKLSEMLEILKYYQFEQDQLSAIWQPEISKLYDLKHLYLGLNEFGADKIEIDAKLLLDQNVNDDEISLIAVEWEYGYMYNKQQYNVDAFENDFAHFDEGMGIIHMEQAKLCKKFGNNLKYLDNMKIAAKEYCHSDFNKSVECFKNVMIEIDDIEYVIHIIYKDINHFGEPILALIQLMNDDKLIKFSNLICNDRGLISKQQVMINTNSSLEMKLSSLNRFDKIRRSKKIFFKPQRFHYKQRLHERFKYNRW